MLDGVLWAEVEAMPGRADRQGQCQAAVTDAGPRQAWGTSGACRGFSTGLAPGAALPRSSGSQPGRARGGPSHPSEQQHRLRGRGGHCPLTR